MYSISAEVERNSIKIINLVYFLESSLNVLYTAFNGMRWFVTNTTVVDF